MTPGIAIEANRLTKDYSGLVAVDSVDFSVSKGECFGVLGPNGAGKTSIMKMVCCISPVTSGQLVVQGMDVMRQRRAIKSVLGVVSQADSLDPGLNVMQNLLSHARFFNIPGTLAKERAWAVLDLFQLREKASASPDHLSGGMRRRLLIGRALLHEPSILILDEPTTGLDPQSRHLVWDRLLQLKHQGITMLLTTHYMDEAAYLCDRLMVIDLGKILAEGTPEKLVRIHAGEQVVQIQTLAPHSNGLLEQLEAQGLDYEDAGDSVLVFGDTSSLSKSESSWSGYHVVRRPANLEDVFLRLTGRWLRD